MTRIERILAGSEVFGSLDDALRRRLVLAMSPTVVAKGDAVVTQGEEGDDLLMVATGCFEVRLQDGAGPEDVIDTIGPGGLIGELQLIVGGAASATVVAAAEAEVLRLPRPDFDALCEASPQLLEVVARVARQRLRRHQLLQVLPAILGPIDRGLLATIERQAGWLRLRRGEVLFDQGDPGDAWYVVTDGLLAVVDPSGEEQPDRLVAEAGRGEAIGELALLTGEPRSATVYALRDTELVRFPMSEFAELLTAAPQAMDAVLRTLAGRLVRRGEPVQRAAAGVTVTLVPATSGVALRAFAQRLAAALSTVGPTRVVSGADVAELGVGRGGRQPHAAHAARLRLGAWLEAQSASHRFLLLVTDESATEWTTRAVDHADQVIIVADATGDPRPRPLEQGLLPPGTRRRQPRRLLALLHRDGSRPPHGTARWLEARSIDAHFHVRLDRSDDVERLARSVAGRGLSLVLSGGGAKGFAQLGVVRAMRELGIPIDQVAGTSAGAMSAFLVAAERTDAEMREAARLFHRARPLSGYTLPLFSLKRGDRLSRALRAQCGKTQIEDLWLPFLAVSSNLTRTSAEHHTRGPAWEALRASSALPGVVEPFLRDGELLVDGALTDNLPVRAARARMPGRVIAVDVSAAQPLGPVAGAYLSPWRELGARLVRLGGRQSRPSPPGLVEVLLHSMLLASLAGVEQMRLEADLCLRPDLAEFGMQASAMHERIIDAGYHHALPRLAAFVAAGEGGG